MLIFLCPNTKGHSSDKEIDSVTVYKEINVKQLKILNFEYLEYNTVYDP